MPKYILHYFYTNSRGMISRAILSHVKADWTNDMVKNPAGWPKIKKSDLCEFEQLPILEIDGKKKYSQSHAIDLYLAETYELMGKDIEENYQITNLLFSFDDFTVDIWYTFLIEDEAKRNEVLKPLIEKFKFYMGKLEKRYVDLGKHRYFLGDKFTLADITCTVMICNLVDLLKFKEGKEIFPNLLELATRVSQNELKEFFEKYYVKK